MMAKQYLKKGIYKESTRVFNINDTEIDKIRVSDKKLYIKKHDSYKHYVFYEDDNEYISLKIFLLDVTGRYPSFDDGGKTMNFNLHNDLLEEFCDVFSNIEDKLGFEINDFIYDNRREPRFKTKVTDNTCFRKNKDIEENNIPWYKTDYNCKIIIKIESVFFNNKDNKNDILFIPQVFLEECRHTPMNTPQ